MGTVDIPNWLKGLPLAPEFRPTDTEFSDPIAYISKIEKEAGAFGICKVIPPLPKPTKKYTFSNLNRSLSRSPDLGSDTNTVHSSSRDKGNEGDVKAVFTTRQQELGHSSRRTKGPIPVRQSAIHKQVWQSGEVYTLEQFESKSKVFARSQLGMIKEVTPLVIEALFWKAACEKPIYLEYANDVPGSGFGEPECPLRCSRKRWRKRKVNKNRLGAIDCEKRKTDSLRNSNVDEEVNVSGMDDIDPSSETSKQSPSSPTLLSDEGSRVPRQKSPNAGSDREGTAGWKLTNSPWNLQVIARSAGSLTRFMLDDIPGVTSPMIYIGMLFSWFAWHVEDHELHSLNYLHSGSPKTWYGVPGDRAFAFEEVIRAKGYGGNIDRLAALMLLGEKTNLLSPEAVVASGIPCCRLVQNPGEFVVTFPRAYHVGFSHGFNCGEAANFGTPQWLKVAKEAAVRRAAMNYLPMLSHQQLLYLLTMSFISSVPRALLPGARSSRLRDRQKEERELVVKKAFIDDMLNEINRVSALLRKESTLYAVLWDPETLPSPCKDLQSLPLCATSETTFSLYDGSDMEVCNSGQKISSSDNLHGDTSNGSTVSIEKSFSVDPINADSCNNQVDPERSYTETVEDMYEVDDDLPCGLQADSGTLACVACGILGFPFMSIVQPSRRASEELFSANSQVIQDVREDSKSVKPQSLSELDDTVKHSISDTPGTQNVNRKGDLSSKYNVQTSSTEAPNSSSVVRSVCNNLEKLVSDATSSVLGATDDLEVKESNKLHHPITVGPSIKTKRSMSCTADASPVPDPLLIHPKEKLHKQWNRSNGFQRPRVFCLEHTLEIEELLRSKGGANVLIICHSAFPKIKAHASAVAEEIGAPFNCEEVPLECASQEDLDLINISIDDEEHEECGEDWTSRLGVNLQYGVKLRKQFPSKQDQHALSLGGLFSEMDPCSDVPCLKWNSRRSRTSRRATGPLQSKLSEKKKVKGGMPLEISIEKSKGNKETKVIQYTRRACKDEKGLPSQANVRSLSCFRKQRQPRVTSTATEVLDSNILMSDDTLRSTDNIENDAQELTKALTVEISEISHGELTSVENRERNDVIEYGNLVSSPATTEGGNDSQDITVPAMENFELQHDAQVPGQTTGTSVAAPPLMSAGLLINERSRNDSVDLANSDMVWSTDETKQMVQTSKLTTTPALDILTLRVSGAEMGSRTLKDKVVKNTQTDKVSDPAKFPCFVDFAISSEAQQGSTSLEEHIIVNKLEDSQRCKVSNPSNFPESPTMSVLLGEISQARMGNQTMEDINMEHEGCNHLNMDNSQMEAQTAIDVGEVCNSENSVGVPEVPLPDMKHSEVCQGNVYTKKVDVGFVCPVEEPMAFESATPMDVDSEPTKKQQKKRKRELEQIMEDQMRHNGFIKSPCEGLRPRNRRIAAPVSEADLGIAVEAVSKKAKRLPNSSVTSNEKKENGKEAHVCDLENCRMSFKTRAELLTHKRNRCTYEGCGKRFSSHKYAMLHQRVHTEERPLKCTWEGCTMSFKWAWARTEHLRLHTGERPYQCKIEGCGLTFRFVSDYSRHRRKTGHYVNSPT